MSQTAASNRNTVYLMGAGASYGYRGSSTGVNPPLATNFFGTFYRLLISQDLEVKIGHIVSYIRDTRGIPLEGIPDRFEGDIEEVFAEVHGRLLQCLAAGERNAEEVFPLSKAYDQFIFWFAHVLNEVQNGAPCEIYGELVRRAEPGDTFVTFNWDTVLDRALAESGRWFPDDGYCVHFHELYENGWRSPEKTRSRWKLLKLHGSTNWLGPYITQNHMTGERAFLQSPDRAHLRWCLVDGGVEFETYKDRWRPGYRPYSYFFPPNDPVSRVPLMPILIPPTGNKEFSEYPEVFEPVWAQAREELRRADRLVIIGYSFPRTDGHAFELLDTFLMDAGEKQIDIIDPYPNGVQARVEGHIAGRCPVVVHPLTLAEYMGFERVDNTHSEYDALEPHPAVERIESDPRLAYLLDSLVDANLFRHTFDLTTRDGRRLLDCSVDGEFASHLQGAYREPAFEHRIDNIPIRMADGTVTSIRLDEIWIFQLLPREPLTEEELAEVDLSPGEEVNPLTGITLREMVRDSYHCTSDQETEYFLRRVLVAMEREPDEG